MEKQELNKFIETSDCHIVDAMKKIGAYTRIKQILFILDDDRRLIGCLTEGDIRRFLIRTGDLHAPVLEAMNRTPYVLHESERNRAIEFCCEKKITAIPLLNDNGQLTDIVFEDEPAVCVSSSTASLAGIPVIIMAGGTGTRLYPYTKILPKPLIPIGDVPIIERIIDRFALFGVSDFYLTVNYKKGMIRSYFNDLSPEYRVTYVEEDCPLGTAGSIRLIKDELDTPIFVTNCDTLIQANYHEIMQYHRASGNDITIVSALKDISIPYGVLNFKEGGLVTSLEEKPHLSYFVNTGLYVINPECVKYIPENTFFHMTHLVERLMEDGKQVGTYPINEEAFLDMGEFEEMKRMEERLNISRG